MIGDIKSEWRDYRLSPNFKLGEFFVSSSHPKVARGMNPTRESIDMFLLLCVLCLQPVRDKFGPVKVTSGMRNQQLNVLIGGSSTSQHSRGRACDFTCPGKSDMKEVYLWVLEKLNWSGELLYYEKRGHVHVGLPEYGVHADHIIIKG